MAPTTSSSAPIDSIPLELLFEIFTEFQTSPRDLVNCMQCNELWRSVAQAVFYRHIVLTSTTVSKFTEKCPSSVDTDGRALSLTLRLDDVANQAGEDVDTAARNGNRSAQDLWHALKALALRLPNMGKLRSVSIYRPSFREQAPYIGFWIYYSTLDNLILNLPLTCNSLELDVNTSKTETHVHLCSTIRKILPRLEHIRLRLPVLCPEICHSISQARIGSSDGPKDPSDTTTACLKQCIIQGHLFGPHSPVSMLCHRYATNVAVPVPSWSSLTQCFQDRVTAGKLPAIEKLWTYSIEPQTSGDRTSYSAYIRHDILANKSLSIPVRQIGGFGKDAWLVRLPGGLDADVISTQTGVNTVVEEYSWQQTCCGARLPVPLQVEHGLKCVPRAPTKQQWRENHTLSCTLWRNEAEVGKKLLQTEEGGLMDEPEVRELAPNGWHWDEVGSILIKNVRIDP